LKEGKRVQGKKLKGTSLRHYLDVAGSTRIRKGLYFSWTVRAMADIQQGDISTG